MSYQPSFVEVFIGWAVCALWARILVARGGLAAFEYLTPAVGLFVLAGQVLGTLAALGATGASESWRHTLLSFGRWGSATAVLAALALLIAGSVALWTKRRP